MEAAVEHAKRRNRILLAAVPPLALATGAAAEPSVPVIQPLRSVVVKSERDAEIPRPVEVVRIAPDAPVPSPAIAAPPALLPVDTLVKATARPSVRPAVPAREADAAPATDATPAADATPAPDTVPAPGATLAADEGTQPVRQASTEPVSPPDGIAAAVAPKPPAIDDADAADPADEADGDETAAPPKPDFAAMRAAAVQLKVPEICTIIEAAADRNNLPKPFLARLIWKESRFDVRAVSPVGALGIAQFMPATAKLEGLRNPFDPREAIQASAKHLADMRREFGNLGLAAIGYNAGRARARAFADGRNWLPAETVDYVISILGREADDYADGTITHPVQPLKKGLEFAAACRKLPVIRTRAVAGIPAASQPWHVQVSRHFARHVAVNMFKRAQKRHRAVLGDMRPIVVVERGGPGMRAQKSVRVGTATRTAAQTLCSRLRQRGAFCLVKRNTRR